MSALECHTTGIAGSDAILIGDFPSPWTSGTVPAILSEVVRVERVIALPEAVPKMTLLAADRLGTNDRGWLQDGNGPTS